MNEKERKNKEYPVVQKEQKEKEEEEEEAKRKKREARTGTGGSQHASKAVQGWPEVLKRRRGHFKPDENKYKKNHHIFTMKKEIKIKFLAHQIRPWNTKYLLLFVS